MSRAGQKLQSHERQNRTIAETGPTKTANDEPSIVTSENEIRFYGFASIVAVSLSRFVRAIGEQFARRSSLRCNLIARSNPRPASAERWRGQHNSPAFWRNICARFIT